MIKPGIPHLIPVLSASLMALVSPAAQAGGRAPCAPLLSPAERGNASLAPAEAAIAGAWAELMGTAGARPTALSRDDLPVAELLAPPDGVASEFASAFESLRGQVLALFDAGVIDESSLRAALNAVMKELVGTSSASRETEQRAHRRRVHVAGEGIPLGAPISTPALVLPDGNLAVGTKQGIHLVSPDGRVLQTFRTHGEVREQIVLLDDGTLVVASHGGKVYFLSPLLEEIAAIEPLLEPGEPVHRVMVSQALTGEVVLTEEHRISLHDRRGRHLRTFTAVGPLYAPPLQLRNGNWMAGGVIRENRGFIEFFSHEGGRIALHTDVGIIASTGLQLPNGNVVIGSGDRFARFYTDQGAILGGVETNGSIYVDPVLLPDGTLAIGNILGVSLLSTHPGAGKPLRRNPGRDWTRGQPLLLADGRTLVFSSTGRTIRAWDMKENREWILYQAGSEISGFPVLLDGETIVAGDNSGRLHFIDLTEAMESK